MKRTGKIVTKKVKELEVTGLNFISLVEEPANQQAWQMVKAADKDLIRVSKKEQEDMKNKVQPIEIRCDKSVYSSADMVKGVLIERGYVGYGELEETDTQFIAKASAEELKKYKGTPREVVIGTGITAITDLLIDGAEEGVEILATKSEDSTTTGEQAEDGSGEEKLESSEIVTDELQLEGAIDVKAELEAKKKASEEPAKQEILFKTGGKTVDEILATYKDLLSRSQKSFSPWMVEYTGSNTFAEALGDAGYDGSVPGMDEVIDTFEGFVKKAFSMGNAVLLDQACTEVSKYLQGLKSLFDEFAMTEFAKRMVIQESVKGETVKVEIVEAEVEKKKELSTEKDSNIQELIKSFEASNSKMYDDILDVIKSNLEVSNANLIKSNERISSTVDKVMKTLEEITNAEQSSGGEVEIKEEVKHKQRDPNDLGGLQFDWTASLVS